MDKDPLLKLISQSIKDIKAGKITEKEVVDYLKTQGQDWHELRKGYENLVKISKIARGENG